MLAPGPAPAAPAEGSWEAQSWAGQGSPKDPTQSSGHPALLVAGGRECSIQGSHSARAACSTTEATAAMDQSRAGKIRHRGAPQEPLRTLTLLGRVVQGLGKCRWRVSVLQQMRPTETLSCPGTSLGPQRRVQDALGHLLPQQDWTGLPGQGLELGEWRWERKRVWKEEGRK